MCARAWGIDVAWVEYDWDAPHHTRVVDHATASRDGTPYAALIERKGFGWWKRQLFELAIRPTPATAPSATSRG